MRPPSESDEIKSTVRIPSLLWRRARAVQSGPRHTLQRMLIEGLELRVRELEREQGAASASATGESTAPDTTTTGDPHASKLG